MTKRNALVCLTGGGTAGHFIPNLVIKERLVQEGIDCFYISSSGLEWPLVEKNFDRRYQISTGKFRRYLSWRNFTDILRILSGIWQSMRILTREQPDLVFSKGGYVSVPVAVAAWLLGIPVLTHESDVSPGLATKVICRFALKTLTAFEDTKYLLKAGASVQTGLPIRPSLHSGSRARGLEFLGFEELGKPICLVIGGSLGAQTINKHVEDHIPELTERYRIVHITGAGKGVDAEHKDYRQFDYIESELADVLACADVVVSRAGANSLFELLALGIPMLLIPLERGSRGDQLHNAYYFQKNGWAVTYSEAALAAYGLLVGLERLEDKRDEMLAKQKSGQTLSRGSIDLIFSEIESVLNQTRREWRSA